MVKNKKINTAERILQECKESHEAQNKKTFADRRLYNYLPRAFRYLGGKNIDILNTAFDFIFSEIDPRNAENKYRDISDLILTSNNMFIYRLVFFEEKSTMIKVDDLFNKRNGIYILKPEHRRSIGSKTASRKIADLYTLNQRKLKYMHSEDACKNIKVYEYFLKKSMFLYEETASAINRKRDKCRVTNYRYHYTLRG